MFNYDFKKAWAQAAQQKCMEKYGELATPTSAAFMGYLGRIFKRESLQHIGQANFLANLQFVREEIDNDIKINKASTGRVAEFISLALDNALAQEKITQTPQFLSARGPK